VVLKVSFLFITYIEYNTDILLIIKYLTKINIKYTYMEVDEGAGKDMQDMFADLDMIYRR